MSLSSDGLRDLFVRDVQGGYREASPEETLAVARCVLARWVRRGAALTDPRVAQDFLLVRLSPLEHEVFVAVLLDNRHRVLEYAELFRGTIDGAEVYSREVVKAALAANAAAMVVAHHHPSGCTEPSAADRAVTVRLKQALALVMCGCSIISWSPGPRLRPWQQGDGCRFPPPAKRREGVSPSPARLCISALGGSPG